MTRFRPRAWTPPSAPDLEGVYAVNEALEGLERWTFPDDAVGPEDIVLAEDGRLYTGTEDGRIWTFPPGGGRPEVIAETGGRPLGIELDADGTLIVCDADRGLLAIDPSSGRLDVLVESVDGHRLVFTNNAAIASDGTIYFSESSRRYGIEDHITDLLEHSGTGRLYAHDRSSGRTSVLLEDLYFANGVALDADERSVVVAETGRYQLTRLWLEGERAGRRAVLIDNLPGFPDNVSFHDGIFWVAIASPRDPLVDRVLLPRPWTREIVIRIPEPLRPGAKHYGFVVGVDGSGQVVHNLQGPSGSYGYITGVREHDGWLYLGSLEMESVGRVRAPR